MLCISSGFSKLHCSTQLREIMQLLKCIDKLFNLRWSIGKLVVRYFRIFSVGKYHFYCMCPGVLSLVQYAWKISPATIFIFVKNLLYTNIYWSTYKLYLFCSFQLSQKYIDFHLEETHAPPWRRLYLANGGVKLNERIDEWSSTHKDHISYFIF